MFKGNMHFLNISNWLMKTKIIIDMYQVKFLFRELVLQFFIYYAEK